MHTGQIRRFQTPIICAILDLDADFTKSFAFSASHARGARSIGANYILSLTLAVLDEVGEKELEAIVQSELISQLHTRDLSRSVDFLKDVEMNDAALLRAFWERLSGPLARHRLKRLALQRDPRTITTLHL